MPASLATVWQCETCRKTEVKNRTDKNPQPQNWVNCEIFTYPDSMVLTFCSIRCVSSGFLNLVDKLNKAELDTSNNED